MDIRIGLFADTVEALDYKTSLVEARDDDADEGFGAVGRWFHEV